MLWKLFVSNMPVIILIRSRAYFTVIISLICICFSDVNIIEVLQNPKIIYVFTGSVFGFTGLLCLVKALKDGYVRNQAYYSLLSTALAAIYSYFLTDIFWNWLVITGGILILSGYTLFVNSEKSQIEQTGLYKQHLYLSGMVISFFTAMVIQWESLKIFKPVVIISVQEITILLLSSVLLLKYSKKRKL